MRLFVSSISIKSLVATDLQTPARGEDFFYILYVFFNFFTLSALYSPFGTTLIFDRRLNEVEEFRAKER